MKTKEPKYVAQTLAWCNERRKEQGKKPLRKMPKGRICSPASCPCGKAANLRVGCRFWAVPPKRFWVEGNILPKCVEQFVVAFDDGKFPQYIA